MRTILLCLLLLLAAPATRAQTPLVNAHAHNDYEHARPLRDALDNGFCSVEADIYLVDGELLVAHDRDKVQKGRTLQSLYLDPLRERVKRNGGRVYRGGPTVILLIDVKSDAAATWAVLKGVLARYQDILTRFTPDRTEKRAVTAIISGARAVDAVAAEKVRYAGIDGRLSDLNGAAAPPSPHLYPLISDSWANFSMWRGAGPMPEADRRRLEEVVAKAHRGGYLLRFWATPDTRESWAAFRAAGVDLINTDDLPGLRRFLTEAAQPVQK
jgi:hypothetical protein